MARGRLAIALVSALLAACAGRDDAPADGPVAQWTLAPEPAVRIGGGDGADALYIATSALRMADGRIAVASAGAGQIRIFDGRGGLVDSVGRKGSGPGELRFPTWIGTRADSLLVWDSGRLSVFGPGGKFVRSAAPELGGALFPSVTGQYADGSLLVAVENQPSTTAAEGRPWRGTLRFIRVAPDGRVMDTVKVARSGERYSYSRGTTGRVAEDLPFGRRTVAAVAGNSLLFGTGEEYRIRAVQGAGDERELIRRAWTPRRVSPDDIRDYWARMVTVGGGERDDPQTTAVRARIPYPKTLPPYERMLVDTDGNIWVQDASLPHEWDGTSRWRVFSPEGALLSELALPGRLTIHQIGPDWILSTSLDDEQREIVRLDRYQRSPAT
ncbi:hypothetical protein [Longimicrobium terrae]|uniref:6-bladed beta-propeller n=1 Tax=Longimicrobium terrae TaxID=1639882 RepID=A0A841H5A5_9BACT|nr:hypothetical protein [Longimicrobium terrae]MBB4639018.1 hypothetical protein [Longimicrobium terrae]MBB6073257.1 hypothetical protein [Longimicrobium terrae]NNC32292.1 hypothetical protein [Longimicrobium terrae]